MWWYYEPTNNHVRIIDIELFDYMHFIFGSTQTHLLGSPMFSCWRM